MQKYFTFQDISKELLAKGLDPLMSDEKKIQKRKY